MRKMIKNILAVAAAAALTAGTLSMAACGSSFKAPTGVPSGDVASNGGFVVSVGDNTNGYYYFINGVEAYTADNTYGSPVKGALMRVKKADALAGKNDSAEVVVPSLMAAGDYTAGLFVYGDRIYYATPTNVRNTSGVVENGYLDFKSAKLDGSDVKDIFRTSSNTTVYRYMEVEGTVYLFYVDGSSNFVLHSVNTETKKDTMLAKNVKEYTLDSADKSNPYIYYRMGVTENADSDGAQTMLYEQIYRVRVDATEVPAGYPYGADDYWDTDWLEENNAGVVPYINLGELVLDGRGKNDKVGDFNQNKDADAAKSPIGFTYDLRSYKSYEGGKGGLYFTLSETNGKGGDLYFLPEAEVDAAGWDSLTGNETDGGKLVKLANSIDAASKATDSAFFYLNGTGHHYLYVSSSSMYRVDVSANGEFEAGHEVQVAYDIGSATIIDIDEEADYSYAYYTQTGSAGLTVERAVFSGEDIDYRDLPYVEGGVTHENTAYHPQKVLNISHTSGWYNYEILDGMVFYVDAETFGGTAYSYVSVVDLKKDGKLMNNTELKAFNESYDAVVNASDKAKGLYAKLDDVFGDSDLSGAFKYYFYTGKSEQVKANVDEAELTYGQKHSYLYTQEEQDAFAAYVAGEKFELQGKTVFGADDYKNAAGVRLTYDDFRTRLGKWSESDEESFAEYWKTSGLKYYTPPAVEEEGLAWWAWLLIGIAIAVVVAAGACGAYVLIKKRGKQEGPKQEKPKVITKDDRNIDVYAEEPTEPEAPQEAQEAAEPEAPQEEAAEEPAEELSEELSEEPAEEVPAENAEVPEAAEAPADAPQE